MKLNWLEEESDEVNLNNTHTIIVNSVTVRHES